MAVRGDRLRVPQARVLGVLYPDDPNSHWIEWPYLRGPEIARIMGTSEVSDFVRRAFRGLREGSPSGNAHPGLLAMGYATETMCSVDGVSEIRYRITAEGIAALCEYLAGGGRIPPLRARESSINDRYRQHYPDVLQHVDKAGGQ